MRRDFRLPRIYPITDVEISGLSHVDQVRLLRDAGATLVQLREKKLPALDFYNEARAVVEAGLTVIVNDRVDVALAINAAGVHLGQDDLPPDAARKLLGEDAIIGFSTHNVAQARLAATLPVDYIAIGPIFQTSTKTNPDPEVGLAGIGAVRDVIGAIPLVAIGGITAANATAVINAGADSVAVISALLAGGATGLSVRYRGLTGNLS